MSLADEWRKRCLAERPSEFVRRFERSHRAQMPAITASLDLPLLRVSKMNARRFLDLAVEIASIFGTLVTAALPHVVEAAGDTPL